MIKGLLVIGVSFVAGAVVGVATYRDNDKVMTAVEDKFGAKLDAVSDKVRPVFRLMRRKLTALRTKVTAQA